MKFGWLSQWTGRFTGLGAGLALLINSAVAKCPCDIYEEGGTPCVAAHSTVRALYSNYNGPLYQVRRTSDGQTKDIGLLAPGGFVNAAVQDSFLAGKPGTISKIYDQSPNGNDLTKAPGGGFPTACLEANAVKGKDKVNGHTVYGVYTTGAFEPGAGSGYRNNKTKNVATGNQAEGMYMVCSGKHYNQWCCFDYGNAQVTTTDNGNSTMETVYFGTSTQWGHGSGSGPWVMADLENGLVAGVSAGTGNDRMIYDGNTPVIADYVTGMVKSKTDDFWSVKGSSATSGKLKTMYSGKHINTWYPKKLEGAIVLGVGGDNSHTGEGTFFEGAMTSGCPSDATEDAIQENIIAAGYGSAITAVKNVMPVLIPKAYTNITYELSQGDIVFRFEANSFRSSQINIFDQQGRQIDVIVGKNGTASENRIVWNCRRIPDGIYVWKLSLDGKDGGSGRIVVGNRG